MQRLGSRHWPQTIMSSAFRLSVFAANVRFKGYRASFALLLLVVVVVVGIPMAAAVAVASTGAWHTCHVSTSTISSLPSAWPKKWKREQFPVPSMRLDAMRCDCVQIAFVAEINKLLWPLKCFNWIHRVFFSLSLPYKRFHTAENQTATNARTHTLRSAHRLIKLNCVAANWTIRSVSHFSIWFCVRLQLSISNGATNCRDYKVNCMTIFGIFTLSHMCHMDMRDTWTTWRTQTAMRRI